MTSISTSLLDRLTDPDEVHQMIGELVALRWPFVTLETAQIARMMPKRSGEILIQYELRYTDSNGQVCAPRILYGQHFPDTSVSPVMNLNEQSMWNEELRLRIWLFPADPELDYLSLLNNSEDFHRVYEAELENVGYACVSMGTSADILGYRLGRRCVARVRWRDTNSDGKPPEFRKNDIVIKMGRKRQALALWTRWRQLEHEGFSHNSSDGIGMPKSLFLHAGTGAIFQDYIHESSLHDMLGSDRFPQHCERAAITLSKLHKCRIPGLEVYTASDELSHLLWLVDKTARTFPLLGHLLLASLDDLVRSIPGENPCVSTTSHRDYYDKQVLSGDARTYLLDCDTLALADPALDCSNFLAHLLWRGIQHPEHDRRIAEGISRFATSYRNNDKSLFDRAQWWTRAALLRLTCIYAWRPRWSDQAARLAEINRESLDPILG